MRRKDREITNKQEILSFLAQQKIMRLAFSDKDGICIIPLNFGYTISDGKLTIWFHGATSGRKYEAAKSRLSAGFETDGNYRLIEADTACGHSAEYMSIVGNGILSIAEDYDEKIKGLSAVMKQATGRDNWEYSPERVNTTAVFRLDVTDISCKARKQVHNG